MCLCGSAYTRWMNRDYTDKDRRFRQILWMQWLTFLTQKQPNFETTQAIPTTALAHRLYNREHLFTPTLDINVRPGVDQSHHSAHVVAHHRGVEWRKLVLSQRRGGRFTYN